MVECVVEFEYVAVQDDELTIKPGDILHNVQKLDGGWWEGEINGRKGVFPDNFVKEIVVKHDKKKESTRAAEANPAAQKKAAVSGGGGHVAQLANRLGKEGGIRMGPAPGPIKRDAKRKLRARVVYSYTPENDDELQLDVGSVIDVLKQEEEGWWEGSLNGHVGVFPSNFVEPMEEDAAETKPVDDQPGQGNQYVEIQGRRVKGIGLGNIFGDGPIKLRSTGAKNKTEETVDPARPPPEAVKRDMSIKDHPSSENGEKRGSLKKVPPPLPKEPPTLPPKDTRDTRYFVYLDMAVADTEDESWSHTSDLDEQSHWSGKLADVTDEDLAESSVTSLDSEGYNYMTPGSVIDGEHVNNSRGMNSQSKQDSVNGSFAAGDSFTEYSTPSWNLQGAVGGAVDSSLCCDHYNDERLNSFFSADADDNTIFESDIVLDKTKEGVDDSVLKKPRLESTLLYDTPLERKTSSFIHVDFKSPGRYESASWVENKIGSFVHVDVAPFNIDYVYSPQKERHSSYVQVAYDKSEQDDTNESHVDISYQYAVFTYTHDESYYDDCNESYDERSNSFLMYYPVVNEYGEEVDVDANLSASENADLNTSSFCANDDRSGSFLMSNPELDDILINENRVLGSFHEVTEGNVSSPREDDRSSSYISFSIDNKDASEKCRTGTSTPGFDKIKTSERLSSYIPVMNDSAKENIPPPTSITPQSDRVYSLFSPLSVSSAEEVPLELSGLSCARQTPPPKMTFRRRRSNNSKGTPKQSPIPKHQSTPSHNEKQFFFFHSKNTYNTIGSVTSPLCKGPESNDLALKSLTYTSPTNLDVTNPIAEEDEEGSSSEIEIIEQTTAEETHANPTEEEIVTEEEEEEDDKVEELMSLHTNLDRRKSVTFAVRDELICINTPPSDPIPVPAMHGPVNLLDASKVTDSIYLARCKLARAAAYIASTSDKQVQANPHKDIDEEKPHKRRSIVARVREAVAQKRSHMDIKSPDSSTLSERSDPSASCTSMERSRSPVEELVNVEPSEKKSRFSSFTLPTRLKQSSTSGSLSLGRSSGADSKQRSLRRRSLPSFDSVRGWKSWPWHRRVGPEPVASEDQISISNTYQSTSLVDVLEDEFATENVLIKTVEEPKAPTKESPPTTYLGALRKIGKLPPGIQGLAHKYSLVQLEPIMKKSYVLSPVIEKTEVTKQVNHRGTGDGVRLQEGKHKLQMIELDEKGMGDLQVPSFKDDPVNDILVQPSAKRMKTDDTSDRRRSFLKRIKRRFSLGGRRSKSVSVIQPVINKEEVSASAHEFSVFTASCQIEPALKKQAAKGTDELQKDNSLTSASYKETQEKDNETKRSQGNIKKIKRHTLSHAFLTGERIVTDFQQDDPFAQKHSVSHSFLTGRQINPNSEPEYTIKIPEEKPSRRSFLTGKEIKVVDHPLYSSYSQEYFVRREPKVDDLSPQISPVDVCLTVGKPTTTNEENKKHIDLSQPVLTDSCLTGNAYDPNTQHSIQMPKKSFPRRSFLTGEEIHASDHSLYSEKSSKYLVKRMDSLEGKPIRNIPNINQGSPTSDINLSDIKPEFPQETSPVFNFQTVTNSTVQRVQEKLNFETKTAHTFFSNTRDDDSDSQSIGSVSNRIEVLNLNDDDHSVASTAGIYAMENEGRATEVAYRRVFVKEEKSKILREKKKIGSSPLLKTSECARFVLSSNNNNQSQVSEVPTPESKMEDINKFYTLAAPLTPLSVNSSTLSEGDVTSTSHMLRMMGLGDDSVGQDFAEPHLEKDSHTSDIKKPSPIKDDNDYSPNISELLSANSTGYYSITTAELDF